MSTRKPKPPLAAVARRRFWQKITRDLVLFSVGLTLFVFEAAIRQGDPRESILIMEAGMMGLPLVSQADWLRRRSQGDEE